MNAEQTFCLTADKDKQWLTSVPPLSSASVCREKNAHAGPMRQKKTSHAPDIAATEWKCTGEGETKRESKQTGKKSKQAIGQRTDRDVEPVAREESNEF